jgi:hypothetical protein
MNVPASTGHTPDTKLHGHLRAIILQIFCANFSIILPAINIGE